MMIDVYRKKSQTGFNWHSTYLAFPVGSYYMFLSRGNIKCIMMGLFYGGIFFLPFFFNETYQKFSFQ